MKDIYIPFPPIMDGVIGTDFKFSIDCDSLSAPKGAELFFKKFGYVVVEGLPQRVDNYEEYFDSVKDILKNYLNIEVEKKNQYIEIFSNKNIDKKLPEFDITSCTVLDSNLKWIYIYIDSKNGEKHKITLEPGRILIYDSSTKVRRYNPNVNLLCRWINKLTPSDYYSNQYFLNYNLK